ncbi:hypothetical protein B0J13DRAFT_156198 [Dactylonectria estremocensis]|uniref:Zn(2)-C6 fungal-type domain-containing protein n=1 Tax=Dactylonectria estremocensis TaxID=1079267 RepID=A0A9P9DP50_9HYPO|nr:hypothetical protein B0J13DRAFT_156198 [Dactylonectria estremocensis]
MNSAKPARLRTKTGCLTCRKRRKKCDEQLPLCNACHLSGRQCLWPTSEDLLDRRFNSHQNSRHRATRSQRAGSVATEDDHSRKTRSESVSVDSEHWILTESGAAHEVVARDLEVVISRHFVERFYGLLLLPKCHPGFHEGWLTEIQDLMVRHKSLYYSVLACAASHIHCIDSSSPMQELALRYYSNALKELSRFLARASQLENHNGLLMSVMLLYLHGCMGYGTNADIPRHVTAAKRILTLRLFSRPLSIDRLFDRLAVESVLYQIFLVSTGLWSDSDGIDCDFDTEFWTRAEQLLDRSSFFPGQSMSFNSPVLGIPVSLFRLAISLRQQYRVPFTQERTAVLERVRSEVEVWEVALLCDQELKLSPDERPNGQERYYRDAAYLYAIIVSMLLEQLEQNETTGSAPVASGESWQVRKAVQILRGHQYDEGWTKCYIGCWPVYTLGFFMSSPEDIELIRSEFQRRWDLTGFSQVSRFSRDLENTWFARQHSIGTPLTTYLWEL